MSFNQDRGVSRDFSASSSYALRYAAGERERPRRPRGEELHTALTQPASMVPDSVILHRLLTELDDESVTALFKLFVDPSYTSDNERSGLVVPTSPVMKTPRGRQPTLIGVRIVTVATDDEVFQK